MRGVSVTLWDKLGWVSVWEGLNRPRTLACGEGISRQWERDGNGCTAWIEVPCQLLVCFPQKTRVKLSWKSMLSAETTVKLSGFWNLGLLIDFTLWWINLARVSEEAQIPKRFRIRIRSCEPPWLSTMSARSVCSGNEQRSSVQKKIAHSKKKRRTFFWWYDEDVRSFNFALPCRSVSDLVMRQIASHTLGFIPLRNSSISRSWYSNADLASSSRSILICEWICSLRLSNTITLELVSCVMGTQSWFAFKGVDNFRSFPKACVRG